MDTGLMPESAALFDCRFIHTALDDVSLRLIAQNALCVLGHSLGEMAYPENKSAYQTLTRSWIGIFCPKMPSNTLQRSVPSFQSRSMSSIDIE